MRNIFLFLCVSVTLLANDSITSLYPPEDDNLDDPFLSPIETPTIPDQNIVDFFDLPLHDWEKQIISYIVTSMSEKNVFQLLLEKRDMERKGKKINPVHPLRFLGYVCEDPKLKKGMKTFKKNLFKWDNFINGLAGRLKEEAAKENLLRFTPQFAQHVGANLDTVVSHLMQADYEGLVVYLMNLN